MLSPGIGSGGKSWSSYWTQQNNFYELWKVTGLGSLVGLIKGDILTVGGTVGSYTIQVPNTANYIALDIDHVFFDIYKTLRLTTEAELVEYDFRRVIVKYKDTDPYSIEYIGILNSGQSVNSKMRSDFHLSIWWDNTLSLYGNIKGNRGIGQSIWPTNEAFITTWDTEKAGGSATKTIVIPTTGDGYDCYITWDNEEIEEHITGTPGNITHVFATTGIKIVKIRGLFPKIYFNSGGDKYKILTIEQWGTIVWKFIDFAGCSNLIGNYIDNPDTSSATTVSGMFKDCANFNSKVNINTSNAITGSYMFKGCGKFNQPISFNTSKFSSMYQMFSSAVDFDQDLSGLDIHLVTNMGLFLYGVNLSPVNYGKILISFAGQSVKNNVSFDGGLSKYTQNLVNSGVADGTEADKLIQSGQNFLTTVTIGDVIKNTTDSTFALVSGIDSDTMLSIDHNIMVSGESYVIQHSESAKARAKLRLTYNWTITDGGGI